MMFPGLKYLFIAGFGCALLSGCASVKKPAPENPEKPNSPITQPSPSGDPFALPQDEGSGLGNQTGAPDTSTPAPPQTPAQPESGTGPDPLPAPPEVPLYENILTGFEGLMGWQTHDPRPALHAFKKSCALFEKREAARPLNANLPQYGTYGDWQRACLLAGYTDDNPAAIRAFFESEFLPANLFTETAGDAAGRSKGLLTGYYEPAISVRRVKDSVYSEPILGKPYNPAHINLPRAQISETLAPVLAYGKPIDVFFMQVQGSGQMVLPDGRRARASFAAHNSQTYKSIGKVLIARGDLSPDRASKQDIEAWMAANGPEKTRALMNENPRYVFFAGHRVPEGEGPKGAMGAALTAMGAIAVDPRYHPYGALVWIDTKLPKSAGDYRGTPAGLLVAVQDTGGAIRGPLRADLYFGEGDQAGQLAGVMKHDVRWTLLLPRALALSLDRQNRAAPGS